MRGGPSKVQVVNNCTLVNSLNRNFGNTSDACLHLPDEQGTGNCMVWWVLHSHSGTAPLGKNTVQQTAVKQIMRTDHFCKHRTTIHQVFDLAFITLALYRSLLGKTTTTIQASFKHLHSQ